MNITRVIQDGVEFFTVDETGESGMSEAGLARLCNVTPMAINKFIRISLSTWDAEKSLEPQRNQGVRYKPSQNSRTSRGQNADIHLVRAEACAKVIEHYAFNSKYKTEEALFAYRKFAAAGITGWIQEMTNWHGNAVPKNGIVIDFNTIEILLSNKLDSPALRLYLYLTKALRLRLTPKSDEIINGAYLSRSTFSTAITKLQDLNLLPDWCQIHRRQQPE